MRIEKYQGYVLFDNNDYPDYPNRKWRARALHFDLRCGIEEVSPEHILQLMSDPWCDHLVWISKRIAKSDQVRMVWVYVHELQHVSQSTLYPGLHESTLELTAL